MASYENITGGMWHSEAETPGREEVGLLTWAPILKPEIKPSINLRIEFYVEKDFSPRYVTSSHI